MKLSTLCVHAGQLKDEKYGGMVSPVYISSAFDYLGYAENQYPRYNNTPNQRSVAQKLAALEGAEAALVYGSGMAAIMSALLSQLKTGDHLVVQNDIYGGTHHALSKEFSRLGIQYTFVYSLEVAEFEKAIRPETKVIYIETPSNPLLKVIDLKAIADLASDRGLISMIDNTFASPVNQQPHEFGIDLVMHSATKYLGGHSDLCAGAVTGSAALISAVHDRGVNFGGSLNARDCSLLERSLKTLNLRVRQQTSNALEIARWLEGRPEIDSVYYPGLESHPQYQLAREQMKAAGAMLSFDLKGDATSFQKRLKLIQPAISLGGVESTITSPVKTSHAKMSDEERQRVGIGENLLRLSVGIEDVDDLKTDLAQALDA